MKTTTFVVLAVALIMTALALGIPAIKGALFPSEARMADSCIPPQFHSDFPVNVEGPIYITPPPELRVLPAGWQRVSSVPNTLLGKEIDLLFIRPQSGYDEIWAGVIVDGGAFNPQVETYFYRTNTEKWTTGPRSPDGLFYQDSYLDSQNNVWVVVESEDVRYGSNQLLRLDEQTNQFVQVMDKANVLSKGNIGSIKSDANGLLWFTMQTSPTQSNLFSFDPVKLEVKQHLVGLFYSDIAIDSAGNVYVLQTKWTPFSVEHPFLSYELTKYNPATGNIDTVEISSPGYEGSFSTSMYIDRENRLWISDNVWIDIAGSKLGVQTAIPRSEIFIYYDKDYARFDWARPYVMAQSVDGRIWYANELGGAWYKPDTGEWCHFTSYGSNIVEDSNHNLWMIIKNDLYELKMTP